MVDQPPTNRRFPLALGVLGLLVAIAAWALWPAPALPAARPLVLVVSGDTAGWIVPCGCTANQSGGLLRRGSFIRDLKTSADVIVVDAGGAAGGTGPYQQVKFEAILRGELAMELDAHNIGGPEAALGAEVLRQLKAPFVSANVRAADGSLIADEIRIVERGGRKVGFIGILSRRYSGPGLQIDDPRGAVLRVAAEAKGKCDSLVVLAYAPEDELRRLAVELPEVDAVIGGPTGQAIAPQVLGPTLLASATNKGKFLVKLEAGPGRTWNGQIVEVDATFADDADQVASHRLYLKDLERRDFASSDSGFAPQLPTEVPANYRVAGSASCQSCHPGDCANQAGTKHAAAWKTLTDRGSHVDSYCQQCHTTGFGLPGGFVSASRGGLLTSVGCESCHGPSQAHVRDPKIRTPFLAKDQCVSCHDHENSPMFNYDAYWAKILHGQKVGMR